MAKAQSATPVRVIDRRPTLFQDLPPDHWVRVSEASKLVGDVNWDGKINNADIDGFVRVLTEGSEAYHLAQASAGKLACGECADINGDGLVNNADVDAFVALLTGD